MLSTDKRPTNNNLKTDDNVVQSMAVGNKEIDQKVAVVSGGVEQDSTLIEKQTESKPELPLQFDDEDDFFVEEDEEIENFIASQSELDEHAKSVNVTETVTVVETNRQEKYITAKEQVVDFEDKEIAVLEEEVDLKEPLDQKEEEIEEKVKEIEENITINEKSDGKKEEVENLDQPITNDAADAAAGTDTEEEEDDNMQEDASPTLITAFKQASPSPPQQKKRDRQSKNTSDDKKNFSTKRGNTSLNNDNNDDEEEEAEYEIEKIMNHRLYKGKVVKYEIKWKGYDEKDNTMEAANIMHDDIYELCRVYWDSHPEIKRPSNAPPPAESEDEENDISDDNMPLPKEQSIKREDKDEVDLKDAYESAEEDQEENEEESGEEDEDEDRIEQEPPRKKTKYDTSHVPRYMIDKGFEFHKSWPQPNTDWNIEMKKFHAIQLSPIDKDIKLAFIEWKNGRKTIHHLQECHKKCPSALIQYYEDRLRFV